MRGASVTCADVMTSDVFTMSPGESVTRASGILVRHKYSGCPVVDGDGVVLGVISELDLLRALYTVCDGEHPVGTVSDYMTPTPIGLKPDAPIEDAARFFFEYPVRRAPVLDASGRLLGVVTRRDVLRALEERARILRKKAAS